MMAEFFTSMQAKWNPLRRLVDFLVGWNLTRDPSIARRRRLAGLAALSFLVGLLLLVWVISR